MESIIYRILNTKNNKVYIGSTNRGYHRLEEHKKRLKSGKHVNKHLQSSWDRNGENSFLFEIIEYDKLSPNKTFFNTYSLLSF